MHEQLLNQFPYAIIRFDANEKIVNQNTLGKTLWPKLSRALRKSLSVPAESDNGPKIHAEKLDEESLHFWLGPEGKVLFSKIFSVHGNTDRLVLIGEEPNFFSALPAPLERILEDFTTDPHVVTLRIASLLQKAVTFERLDLMRVDRNLGKYVYEYSIGLDVKGVLHTAYSTMKDLGLDWISQNLLPHLVETFTPERFSFREDPQLFQSGFRSILRVPIVFDHGAIGAILLASARVGHFALEDAMLVDQIAKYVAHSFFHAGTLLNSEYQTLASSTLLQTVVSGIPSPQMEEFLLQYCLQLRQISEADRVGLSLLDRTKGMRCCVAEAGKELAGAGQWVPLNNSGITEMLRSKSIVSFNLADPHYENLEEELNGSGFTAILYAPVENEQGEIVAALTAVTTDERALSQPLAGLFRAASEQLGLILSKGSLNLCGNLPRRIHTASQLPQGFQHIVGSSPIIRDTIRQASVAAKYDFPILITGETGTGKELFAKAIHESSSVSGGPFIVVNSAAIPPNLLESELFGYQEGAFTGGVRGGKKGKIMLANNGTLFLDEIGELSPELQAKILRVVQEQEVEPLGSTKPINVRVRIISATHRDLKQMVQKGEFREDLLYRLNAIEIKLPPLRERKSDVLELAEHTLQHLAKSHGTPLKRFSADAKQMLLNYLWPGNVRQLQNIINRLFVFVEGQIISVADLPPDFTLPSLQSTDIDTETETETERMERLLLEFAGNKTALAYHLGITRTGLWKKLKRLGVQ
ncbi:MAG: sigma 54-interacting transcriptional regulator [Desulfitobacteriaceae bacterium]